MGLDDLVKTLDFDDFEILKKETPDKRKCLNKKIAHPYEDFKSIDGFQKPDNNWKKGDFFSNKKYACPSDEKIERTKEFP